MRQPDSPPAPSPSLHNSRDCRDYLLSLPNGEKALHQAIKQAKQYVRSQAGSITAHLRLHLHTLLLIKFCFRAAKQLSMCRPVFKEA